MIMEERYIIKRPTDEEIMILKREGFSFGINPMTGNCVVIGDKEYYKMALHAIRRLTNQDLIRK